LFATRKPLGVDADRLEEEAERIARSDICRLVTKDGALIPLEDLPADLLWFIASGGREAPEPLTYRPSRQMSGRQRASRERGQALFLRRRVSTLVILTMIETRALCVPKELLMPSRKLDELATDIDDARTTVDELQNDRDTDSDEKLDDLQKTLEDASDTIDNLEDKDK
jgi:hypothetical protein